MLGQTTLFSSNEYCLTGTLLRPDLLLLRMINIKTPTKNQYYRQIDDAYVVETFKGEVKGVKELFHNMGNNQNFQLKLTPHVFLEFTSSLEQNKIAIPMISQDRKGQHNDTNINHKNHIMLSSEWKNDEIQLDQKNIEQRVADKIFDKLFNCQQFKNQMMTRNQSKIHKLTDDFREVKDQCESQALQILRLKKSQKQLKEEVKNIKFQLRKSQLELSNRLTTCQNCKKIPELEAEIELQRNMIATTNQELSYIKKMQKGYSGRKLQEFQHKGPAKKQFQIYFNQNSRSRQNLLRARQGKLLQINEQCFHFSDFVFRDNLFQLKNRHIPLNSKNYHKEVLEWKYLYFNNPLPYSGKFSIQFNILRTLSGNISFGIVQKKYCRQKNCFNAKTCIEYVGFSSQIFESGKAALPVGKTLASGDEITFEVRMAQGMLVLRNFSGLIVEYESAKLRKSIKTTTYLFYFRLRDKQDVIQIITPIKPINTQRSQKEKDYIPQNSLK